jgi:hypothetical protein
MPIQDITERWSADETNQESPDAKNYTLTTNRVLDVTVDDPENWNSLFITAAMVDPQIRNSYPFDFFLRCDNLNVKRISPFRYEVSAHYETHAKLEQSPLDLPPDISYDSIVTEEEIDQDADGNPILTVLGEGFDPPVREPSYDTIIRVSRNLATYDEDWAQSFRNRVNSAEWKGYQAGTVRVVSIKGDSVADQDFIYWRVSAEFQIRDPYPGQDASKTWYKRLLANGFTVRNGAGKIGPALLETGEFSGVPVLHDTTTGAQITDPTMAQWYYFKTKRTADLNDLGLIDG